MNKIWVIMACLVGKLLTAAGDYCVRKLPFNSVIEVDNWQQNIVHWEILCSKFLGELFGIGNLFDGL